MNESRRSPTVDELQTWRTFVEVSEELRAAMARRLQEDSGLSTGDYAVLLALTEDDEHRMRSSDLAAHIGWERSRLSHHLGRMEKRGMVAREDCATDNRGAEIVLTAEGRDAFRRSTRPHLHAIREHFVDALTPDQLTALGDAAVTLRRHLAASA
jgi:DNA-binding MarR family transcriptional regulator